MPKITDRLRKKLVVRETRPVKQRRPKLDCLAEMQQMGQRLFKKQR